MVRLVTMTTEMTIEELFEELGRRKALIVHCSRPGKIDEGLNGTFFPDDLRTAIDVCSKGSDLSCSVIWPDHIETFGAIGIVLKPRATSSIPLAGQTDAGTILNRTTGRRQGIGPPFSRDAVLATFEKAKDHKAKHYNEWVVRDAETIGLFVHPKEPLEVARVIDRAVAFKGIDKSVLELLGEQSSVEVVPIKLSEVAEHFAELPIYTFCDDSIVQLKVVAGSTLYGLSD